MMIFSFFTAWMLHAVTSICTTFVLLYGVSSFLEAHRSFDLWLEKLGGGGWGTTIAIILIAFLMGREVSWFIMKKFAFRWLRL